MTDFDPHATRSVMPPAAPRSHPLEGPGRFALPGEIELRNRAFQFSRAQKLALLAGLCVPPVVIGAMLLGLLAEIVGGADARTMQELVDEFGGLAGEQLRDNGVQVVLFALTTLVSLGGAFRGFRERVFVGPAGIRYSSGMPSFLGSLRGDWSATAEEIREIRVANSIFGANAQLVQLLIETPEKTRKLGVFNYVDPARYTAKDFDVFSGFSIDEDAATALFETMPLVEFARSAGHDVALPEGPANGWGKNAEPVGSLNDKPRLSAALLVAFVAFTYAAIDMGFISEAYATGAPLDLILAGGAVAAGLTWLLLGTREISPTPRAGVAGLLALMTMAALYPGLIRVNRIGAPAPTAHAYLHTEAQTLEPVEQRSPALDLPHLVERLAGSQPGDVHEFWLRRGALGFHQIQIDAVEARIEALEHGRG